MEFEHGTRFVRSLEALAKTSAKVDARLEPSVGIKRVLQTSANVFLQNHEREDSEVRINGRVVTRIVFIDENGNYNSDERTNNFSERIILSNPVAVGDIVANAHVIDVRMVDHTAQSVDAQVNFEITLIGLTSRDVRFIANASGDVETRTEKTRLSTWGYAITSRFEVEERIDLDKSCEGVLGVDVVSTLREITVGVGKATTKGAATVNIQAIKRGEEQTLYNDQFEFDFSKTIQNKMLGVDDHVVGTIHVVNVEARAESKELPQLVVSAELEFRGFSVETLEVNSMVDAFSFANNIELRTTSVENIATIPNHFASIEVDSNLAMGDKSPFITKIMSVGHASVSSLNILPANDKVTLEGALSTTAVFECEEKQIHSHAVKVPFSATVKMDGVTVAHNIQANIVVTSCKVRARRGRELLVDARLGVTLGATTMNTVQLVTDVVMGDAKPVDDHAILIYAVTEGETQWDIAKRLNCRQSEVDIQNNQVFIYRPHVVNF